MKFSELASYFDEIDKTSSRLGMTRLLGELLKKANPHEASIICNISMGQLHAVYVGTQFNMAEKMVLRTIAQFLGHSDAVIGKEAKEKGDLGAVVELYEWKTKEDLTILQVYRMLCELEETGGEGSQEAKVHKLQAILEKLDPKSAKFVVRIVIGKLRLGFSDMTLVDALSWMEAGDKSLRTVIEDAYNICADLGAIAQMLKEKGVKALEHEAIKVGIPILPAAAERLPSAEAIIKKLGHCVAQPKLDGFRLQVHYDHTKHPVLLKFFSRNLLDMTGMFPDLAKAFRGFGGVKTLICEGEAIGYDTNSDSFLPFQETVKRRRKHGIEQAATDFPLRLFLFDILYLNGHSLLNEAHEKRRKKLLQVGKHFASDTVQVIDERPMHTAKQLQNYFNEMIAQGLEGLVVKRPDAIYQAGKRNFNWIKLKRESDASRLEDTLDVVVLGYYAGRGKRASFGIGAFLVGVYNKKEDQFETLAKVGTGLSDQDWKEMKKKCDAYAVKTKPKDVVCSKVLTPDVWVQPHIVCVIRADEITQSPQHTAGSTAHSLGHALRFPRFMDYRSDKGPYDVTTSHEIKRMYEDQRKKR